MAAFFRNHLLRCVVAGVLSFFLANSTEAQLLRTLHTFPEAHANGSGLETNGTGATSWSTLVLSGNRLYGTTESGGTNGTGAVFAVNTDGTDFTNLHFFDGGYFSSPSYMLTNRDGAQPAAGLIVCGDRLYGTTASGGVNGCGTLFAINKDGTGFTNFYVFSKATRESDFTNSDGAFPACSLILHNGKFYGTTQRGGIGGGGAIFAIETNGASFANLHSFEPLPQSHVNVGGGSPVTGLVACSNTIFGTTGWGEASGVGTVFSISTDGSAFTNLHVFNGTTDGAHPYGVLVLRSNMLYGTTSEGGMGFGTVFSLKADATGFTPIHIFDYTSSFDTNNTHAFYPHAGLLLWGNTLFGTTYGNTGGLAPLEPGKIFAVNIDGTGYTNLYAFTPLMSVEAPPPDLLYTNNDGANLAAQLVRSGNTLYGTTSGGAITGSGTVFALDLVPSLGISIDGPQTVISWPTWAQDFSLQTATNLPPSNWENVSASTVIVDGQNVITNSTDGSLLFYRLKLQMNPL